MKTKREAAIDAAMKDLYGIEGPDETEFNVPAIRAILGRVYDAGKAAR